MLANPLYQSFDTAYRRLLTALSTEHPALVCRYPPHRYLDDCLTLRGKVNYRSIGEAGQTTAAALQKHCPTLACHYNKLLIAMLGRRFDMNAGSNRIPACLEPLYRRELTRIRRQLDILEDDFFHLDNDVFLKDLALLSHRLIPIGAEMAEVSCGIPRSILFKGGLAQFAKSFFALVCLGRGFKPYYQLHLHRLSTDEFNPEGWQISYRRLAELLALNPQMKGWYSASWFLDPKLADISPHLNYLRTIPQAHGAWLFFVEYDHQGSKGALFKSAKRRQLFAEGKYTPAIYMRIWLRASMLEWLAAYSEKNRP